MKKTVDTKLKKIYNNIVPETDGLDLEFDDGDFMLIRYRSVIGSKIEKEDPKKSEE